MSKLAFVTQHPESQTTLLRPKRRQALQAVRHDDLLSVQRVHKDLVAEFNASTFGGEVPVCLGVIGIEVLLLLGGDFVDEGLFVGKAQSRGCVNDHRVQILRDQANCRAWACSAIRSARSKRCITATPLNVFVRCAAELCYSSSTVPDTGSLGEVPLGERAVNPGEPR
jgi:hypothetical protein